MFTEKALQTYIEKANYWIDYYKEYYTKNPEKAYFDICFSKGNRKISKALNLSLLPIFTCGKNCIYCKCYCYDIKACLQYENVLKARARNTVIYNLFPQTFFNRIDHELNKHYKLKYFRFHVGGDIPNYEYFVNMVKVINNHKDWFFWTYTKQYYIVNKYMKNNNVLPKNLSIMFSNWNGLLCDNPFTFPEFKTVMKNSIKKPIGFYCPGDCSICINNNCGCIAKQTVYCNEH